MTWLTLIQANTYRKQSRLTRSSRPRLEPLEDRQLPSTCHVTRLSDSGIGKGFRGDLRYCINKVNTEPEPDAIDFTVTGTINLTSALPNLASDVEIQGPGSDSLSIRRHTSDDYRIFTIGGGTVLISGLKMSNGQAEVGGGIYNQATLTLENVIVDSNISTSGVGGGIYNAGVLTVSGSLVRRNRAASHSVGLGGGVFNESGAIAILSDSSVVSNEALNTCQGGSCNNDVQTAGAGVYNGCRLMTGRAMA